MKTLMTAVLLAYLLGGFRPLVAQDLFDNADADRNDVLVYSEVTSVLPAITKATFEMADQNTDGVLDYDEFSVGFVQGLFRPQRLPRRSSPRFDGDGNAPVASTENW